MSKRIHILLSKSFLGELDYLWRVDLSYHNDLKKSMICNDIVVFFLQIWVLKTRYDEVINYEININSFIVIVLLIAISMLINYNLF